MPSVATWWCGEPAALEYAFAHLDELVIKRCDPVAAFDPVFGNELTAASASDVAAPARPAPQAYVAQELVRFSQAPVWTARTRAASPPARSACASSSPPPPAATW